MNAPLSLSNEVVRIADLRQPDEAARIEGFVSEIGGSVFHRPAWLQAVERGTGQRAFGLVAERLGIITGWLPLTEVHSPVFGRMLASSGFAVAGGALAERPSTAIALCRPAERHVLRPTGPTVELRVGSAPSDGDKRGDAQCGFGAELAESRDVPLLASRRKQRAEVRKGLESDLEVRIGRETRDRADHYAV